MASDLRRFFGCRIADWHSGELSSFELLEMFGASVDDSVTLNGNTFDAHTTIVTSDGMSPIAMCVAAKLVRTFRVDFAPEDGAVAAEMRSGERPEWKQMLAQSANELAVLRVAQVPGADADAYSSRLFLPVARQREMAEEYVEIEGLRSVAGDGTDDGMQSMWTQEVS